MSKSNTYSQKYGLTGNVWADTLSSPSAGRHMDARTLGLPVSMALKPCRTALTTSAVVRSFFLKCALNKQCNVLKVMYSPSSAIYDLRGSHGSHTPSASTDLRDTACGSNDVTGGPARNIEDIQWELNSCRLVPPNRQPPFHLCIHLESYQSRCSGPKRVERAYCVYTAQSL